MIDSLLTNSCWFCNKGTSDPKSSIKMKMYKVVGRSAKGTARRVDYTTQQVLIPRCRHCKSIHDKAKLFKWAGILLIIAAGIGIAAIAISNDAPTWLCWVAPIAGVIIVGVVMAFLQQKYGSRPGVKEFSQKDEYPPIKLLKSEGWLDDQPMA